MCPKPLPLKRFFSIKPYTDPLIAVWPVDNFPYHPTQPIGFARVDFNIDPGV